MKTILLVAIALLSLAFGLARAASPEEEARFVAAAKQAFQAHDAEALSGLTCWDGVPEKLKKRGQEIYVRDLKQTASEIILTAPDPKFPDLDWKDEGVTYHSNLPVVKQLKITFAAGGRFKNGVYPVGERSGKLWLLQPAPVK